MKRLQKEVQGRGWGNRNECPWKEEKQPLEKDAGEQEAETTPGCPPRAIEVPSGIFAKQFGGSGGCCPPISCIA